MAYIFVKFGLSIIYRGFENYQQQDQPNLSLSNFVHQFYTICWSKVHTDELTIPAVLEGRRDVTPSVLKSTTGLEGDFLNLWLSAFRWIHYSYSTYCLLLFFFSFSLSPVLFQCPICPQRSGVFQAALVSL